MLGQVSENCRQSALLTTVMVHTRQELSYPDHFAGIGFPRAGRASDDETDVGGPLVPHWLTQ